MRFIISLLIFMFMGILPVCAQSGRQDASTYNFSQLNGKTISHIASSPNGKFLFIRFTDGTSIRVSTTATLNVQQFGN